jgi:hypothetical protein
MEVTPKRKDKITTNTANQPFARFVNDAVELTVWASPESTIPTVVRLSDNKAEELAIELDHAAKMMRGEV